jgi:hypothetical protein
MKTKGHHLGSHRNGDARVRHVRRSHGRRGELVRWVSRWNGATGLHNFKDEPIATDGCEPPRFGGGDPRDGSPRSGSRPGKIVTRIAAMVSDPQAKVV